MTAKTGKTAMTPQEPAALEALWHAIPALLEAEDGWALREVLAAGVAGYTREADTPEGLLIRHNPDGTRQLVRVNLDGPDTIIRDLA